MNGQREHLFGLDAVRCAAISLVLGCHCGLAYTAWFLAPRPAFLSPLGYYGVELFFVLSGVLIGRILLDSMVARTPTARDWGAFMVRRWIRTLPLYFAWLVVLLLSSPPAPADLRGQAMAPALLAFATFRQNLFWPPPDWFPVSWSLAIEEWFYLLFSGALLLAVRTLGPRRGLGLVLGAFLCLPPGLRLCQDAQVNWNEVLHKAVLFRLDAIAFGVLAILLVRLRTPSARKRTWLFAVGAAMILLQCLLGSDAERVLGPVPSRALGFDVTDGGFALMLPAAMRLPRPAAWLAWPVSLFAAQSYGTYIVHSTVLGWVGLGRGIWHWDGLWCALGASALILWLPMLLWFGLERPALAFRPALPRASFPDGGGRTAPGRAARAAPDAAETYAPGSR